MCRRIRMILVLQRECPAGPAARMISIACLCGISDALPWIVKTAYPLEYVGLVLLLCVRSRRVCMKFSRDFEVRT
jgi:hypothetical protein